MTTPKPPEALEERAIRLHPEIYLWAKAYALEHPSISEMDLQDAIYKAYGKEHLVHSFDILLIARAAIGDKNVHEAN